MAQSNDEERLWGQPFREWRHNPCIMSPIALTSLLIIGLLSLVGLLLQFPTLIIGFILSPLLSRSSWIIEFLYPLGIGRSVHCFLVSLMNRSHRPKEGDKNRGFHSRTLETSIEVVRDRVYIHPLPQWLDNLGYLVVCLPNQPDITQVDSNDSSLGRISVTHIPDRRIVALVVDCGDSTAVLQHIEQISQWHYSGKKIEVQAILSTHKHHDHTAGNRGLLRDKDLKKTIKIVAGGAVEKVPHCNFPVADGDLIPLPKYGENNMNDVVEIEAIATPAHTRGSITYIMRCKQPEESIGLAYLFTGDTIFSGGGGVPFEADMEKNQEGKPSRMTPSSFIKANASSFAVERCFAEILSRMVPDTSKSVTESALDQVLIMPGHEYTQELISRQLKAGGDMCKWKNFPPSVFFNTMSQLYIAMHRRSLPHSSGRLLCVPSPLSRELIINTHFRSLRKRAEQILYAINFWHRQFATVKVPDLARFSSHSQDEEDDVDVRFKSPANTDQWIINAEDIATPIFTTVYAADLETIIYDLEFSRINSQTAVHRLLEMKQRVQEPVIGRRPIPGTLPTDRAIYKGLVGLALLGSRPSALTLSDSRAMKLPAPIVSSSDRIRVSCKRLIRVLQWLYMIGNDAQGRRTMAIIRQLWRSANAYETTGKLQDLALRENENHDVVDSELDSDKDEVELGSLKWVIYGVGDASTSCLRKFFCRPCTKATTDSHPIQKSSMNRSGGELVRHDVFSCYLCRTTAGCPLLSEEENGSLTSERPVLKHFSSTQTISERDQFVEVASMLREA
jgi:glyoxylase-like metal-dependent hydrolase (beta-lactamase superfamily II)